MVYVIQAMLTGCEQDQDVPDIITPIGVMIPEAV